MNIVSLFHFHRIDLQTLFHFERHCVILNQDLIIATLNLLEDVVIALCLLLLHLLHEHRLDMLQATFSDRSIYNCI